MHAYNRMLPISPSLVFEAQKTNVHYNPQNPICIFSPSLSSLFLRDSTLLLFDLLSFLFFIYLFDDK